MHVTKAWRFTLWYFVGTIISKDQGFTTADVFHII